MIAGRSQRTAREMLEKPATNQIAFCLQLQGSNDGLIIIGLISTQESCSQPPTILYELFPHERIRHSG